MLRAICLQHVPFEGPGAFARALTARGVSLESYLVPQRGLPKDAGDVLIVMGGPMSVNDPAPWITEETEFIRTAILASKTVIGVCLGSQFMAKALGAKVRSGKELEIGMTPVHLTKEGKSDPVFGACPETFQVFEWHGEVFDLPESCVPLASSEIAPLQAFRYGARAYGLLFHVEMEPSGIDSLCLECSPDLTRTGLVAEKVKSTALSHLPQLHRTADRLVAHLLDSAR